MLCSNCNKELYKQEIVDKVSKRIDKTYLSYTRIIYNCLDCKYFRLEFKKKHLNVNIYN